MWALYYLGREQTLVVHYTIATSEIIDFVLWLFAYGGKLSRSSVGVLNTLLSRSQPFMVAPWKWYAWCGEVFCSWSSKPTSGGLCLNTGMSLLGIDHKTTGSEALGCVGNGAYEVLVVPKKCTKLMKHVQNILWCAWNRWFDILRGKQSATATSWVGFHCYSAILLSFQAPANKFFSETVFSLSNHSKLKSTWRENSSLSGKAKNDSWGNCGW